VLSHKVTAYSCDACQCLLVPTRTSAALHLPVSCPGYSPHKQCQHSSNVQPLLIAKQYNGQPTSGGPALLWQLRHHLCQHTPVTTVHAVRLVCCMLPAYPRVAHGFAAQHFDQADMVDQHGKQGMHCPGHMKMLTIVMLTSRNPEVLQSTKVDSVHSSTLECRKHYNCSILTPTLSTCSGSEHGNASSNNGPSDCCGTCPLLATVQALALMHWSNCRLSGFASDRAPSSRATQRAHCSGSGVHNNSDQRMPHQHHTIACACVPTQYPPSSDIGRGANTTDAQHGQRVAAITG
jgi:hypothetical protein